MDSTGLSNKEIIALVDCNNFYVSCERVFNPKLAKVPVAVLSNNDGCIVSRSNEIKALKIPMGAPGFKQEAFIHKHGGVLLSSNYALYGDMSARVMNVLSMFSPDVEIYSIDEAFLNLSGLMIQDYEEWGRQLKRTVFRWTGIPVSVGISRSKTLAKCANHHAKRVLGFKGSLALLDETRIAKALQRIDVGDVWGIGRQYQKFLKQNKIENALQLRDADDKFIDHYMTVVGHKTILELRGYSCVGIDEAPQSKKSIVTSKSFGRQVTDQSELAEAVSTYVTRSAEKLRAQKSVAGHLMVFLSTNRFKEGPQYNNSLSTTLFPPTAYTPDMIRIALQLLDDLYLEGFEYKKAGVMLADIMSEGDVPLSFIEANYLDDRRSRLMQAVDRLNKAHGRDTVTVASSGVKKEWEMRRAKLSPRFTTSWNEIPKVK
ncbi:MAG: Y-family DNA polymerase [Candidatus Cloacimonetes bacterium]|jgi:DNA polymerase V|nr:Y-family DNA polymerase [Candidatus Cloacimonadota bacterium]MDY0336492.1 Y-family DNA polymerase [Candidatus Cloacimonadaceae bacterium]MCB5269950.1 Y-family DNA polymerase [Candidatus Cloacimonadota bacterium]MCK9333876.1 Y-family DNA polymerase [Candidatus Cloacimonadota bacterium]MDD2543038.1 Y-family DNA polymerase [Candidatus Cloacimonadota bacterium]